MQLDFYGALVAVFAAGGFKLIFYVLPQLIPIQSQKENKLLSYWLLVAYGFLNTMGKSNVVTAFFVGCLLGNPLGGLAVGAVIELMFLGVFVVGASIPPQPFLSTILTTVFVIRGGLKTEEAIALIVPIAVLAQLITLISLSFNQVFLGIGKRQAAEGDIHGIDFTNGMGQIVSYGVLGTALPAFLGAFFGIPLVQGVVAWLSGSAAWVLAGLGFLSGVLPALGFALLFYQMGTKYVGYLIIGLVVGIYVKPDPLALALAGVAIALVHMQITKLAEPAPAAASDEEAAAPAAPKKEHTKKITDEDLLGVFWRHGNLFSTASWEVLGGLGFGQAMVPVIRRLYTTKEDISEALSRHIVFYNTNPWLGGIIPGIVASMEEEKANGEAVDEAAIQGVKVGMMGPFAGVGDSLFWATYIPIILAITASWARSDSTFLQWLAPLTAGTILILSNIFIPWTLMKFGYKQGLNALQDLGKRNLLADLSTGASVVGMFVIGGMVIKLVSLQIRWAPAFFGTSPIKIQSILDSIMPSIIPLTLFFLAYWLLRKGRSAIFVMVVLMVICLVGAIPLPGIFNNTSILGAPIKPAATSLLNLLGLF